MENLIVSTYGAGPGLVRTTIEHFEQGPGRIEVEICSSESRLHAEKIEKSILQVTGLSYGKSDYTYR